MSRTLGRRSRDEPRQDRKIGFVLWNGNIGGAEVFSVTLAERMSLYGIDVELIFIGDPMPLASRIPSTGPRYRSLGLRRGRSALRHPRRYAAEIARVSKDGVLLVDCGFMGGALRAGGYHGSIVAVEHGALLGVKERSWHRSFLRRLSRATGAWADDIEVAVSDFVLADMAKHPHAATIRRVYNGVDPARYRPVAASTIHSEEVCVIAFAGRLVCGKGVENLLHAMAQLTQTQQVRLLIAGEGPARPCLEELSRSLGVAPIVTFLGLVEDMSDFWASSDLAVIPSAGFVESCPVTALEAMAAGKPLIATSNGGLPELVVDGRTGTLVPVEDNEALAHALDAYIQNASMRVSHGRSGEVHVAENFHIDASARAYVKLFDSLESRRQSGLN